MFASGGLIRGGGILRRTVVYAAGASLATATAAVASADVARGLDGVERATYAMSQAALVGAGFYRYKAESRLRGLDAEGDELLREQMHRAWSRWASQTKGLTEN